MKNRAILVTGPFLRFDPDLAYAASDAIGFVMSGFGQWFQSFSEFDHIAVAILPIVQEGEIFANGFDGGQLVSPLARRRDVYSPSAGSEASFASGACRRTWILDGRTRAFVDRR